ncbi:unnamed protein product, partial [Ixodes pacificus]
GEAHEIPESAFTEGRVAVRLEPREPSVTTRDLVSILVTFVDGEVVRSRLRSVLRLLVAPGHSVLPLALRFRKQQGFVVAQRHAYRVRTWTDDGTRTDTDASSYQRSVSQKVLRWSSPRPR